jgi:hypothetical protein
MSIIIEVKVIPKSKKSVISIDKTGNLRIYLKSVPENGKANQELIKLIAKTLKVPQSNVVIISGFTARLKRVHITGTLLNKEEFISNLLPYRQQELF